MAKKRSPKEDSLDVDSKKSKKEYVLGIRREDKNRWERRAPLAPQHVGELVKKGIKVIVQPSSLRTFSDSLYEKEGAILQEDLSEANTIIAVKEVPPHLLLPNKTYCFFSHTIKAQPYNMGMLDDILNKNIRLIDYETITDESGKRLVRFGKFAGYAGMIDTLHGLGDRMLALGHSTPFLHLGYSYCYNNLETAKEAVQSMGEEIASYGLPSEFVPMTFAFTSKGNVSQGAQEIFKLLPHKMVTPAEMVDLVKNPEKASSRVVYGTILTTEDFIEHKKKAKFNKQDYYEHPENYKCTFAEKYAPYISVLMNCMYWEYRFPRLISIQQMEEMVEKKNTRLLAIGDISCDPGGSIEFLMKTTSIDSPLFIYDPKTHSVFDSTSDHDYIYKDGILFCAVDNFPTELPKEATKWFGVHLLPFLEPLVKSDPSKPYEKMTDLPPEIHRATIAAHGKLTPKYEYITELRKQNEANLHRILILGAGHVAFPVVEYLSRNLKNSITVVDIDINMAKKLCDGRSNCFPMSADIGDETILDRFVEGSNFVVSLLPATFNVLVAKACLRRKRHMVTASYISPELKKLHQQIKEAGLTCLNEIGLDPGIDHLEAMRMIDDIHAKGGKVRDFVSWCGGVPMPEYSGNPFGYKFSWSPRGVLVAATRDARYLQDGKIIDIPGSKLFKSKQPINIFPGFNLEGLPNRDATHYAKEYGIQDEVHTFFRGSLRYKGYADIFEAFADIGILNEQQQTFLQPDAPEMTWNQLIKKLMNIPESSSNIMKAFKKKLQAPRGYPSKGYTNEKLHFIIDAFEWLGMFSEEKVARKGTYLDALAALMQEKMKYEKGEKDMILLHHIFGVEWSDGKKETQTSTLVVHGNKDGGAMARSVGIPVALAAELIMSGIVKEKGVVAPMSEEIYRPLLKALANEGLNFVHKSYPIKN